MITNKIFTASELKEVEEVAKLNNVTETARHFKITVSLFKRFREIQPELEEALQRGLGYKNDKIFTKEELLEVETLAITNNFDSVGKHFNLKLHNFSALKKSQPDLAAAYQRGVEQRGSSFFERHNIRKPFKLSKPAKPIKITEDTLNMSVSDMSPQQALYRYQEKNKIEKRHRLQQELREIDL